MNVKGVVVRVPAKVNLQLSVGPLGEDGYHEVVSVFQAISIFDEVTIKYGAEGSGILLTVGGSITHGVPTDSSNLAYRAAQIMIDRFHLSPDIEIDIKKDIPVDRKSTRLNSSHT